MDFFSSLNQVRKHSGQLDAWEKQQRDKDAQRNAYLEKHAPTEEELQHAKELGDTLINAIDVMDDHSESVAENVETATADISTLTMLLGGGATAYLAWNLGMKPANKEMNKLIKEFDNDQKTKDFVEKLNKEATVREPNGRIDKTYFGEWNFRSDYGRRKLERITDSNLRKEALEMSDTFKKAMKPLNKKFWLSAATVPIVGLVSWFMGNVYETKLQVDSSRIARFQARRELNDPKSFVRYTPEQIAEAKEVLKKHPKRIKKAKKDNLKKGFFSSIREILRDSDNYKRTKKLRDKQQAVVTRPLSDEEILQAKKDQEVIQRIVKHINNEAEKNSEKMETAANVIFGTFPIVSGAVAAGLTWGLEKTGLIKKWVENYIDKNGTDAAKEKWKNFKDIAKDDPKYTSKWKELFHELTDIPLSTKQLKEMGSREAKEMDKLAKDGSLKAKFNYAKNAFSGLMAHKYWGKTAIGMAAGLLAAFPTAILALKLQKDAARAGRYTAKRELEQDPRNFIGLSDTELEEVKDVKNNKKPGSKIKEYALFIPTVLRDWWKYNKFRNKEMIEKKALNKELKKLDVSDEQLRDAKNLQAKVFNTFDKIDDKSQSYSEATEAAIETLQPLVYMAGGLAIMSPLFIFAYQASKGKFTTGKIAGKITGFLASSTALMKSKLFKGYLKGVAKHTETAVNNVKTSRTYLGAMMKDVDLLETPVVEIPSKTLSNLRNHISTTLRGKNEEEQFAELWKIRDELFRPMFKIGNENKKELEFVDQIFSSLTRKYYWTEGGEGLITPEIRANAVDVLLLNSERVSKMSPEEFNKAKNALLEMLGSNDKNIENLSKFMIALEKSTIGNIKQLLGPIAESKPEIAQILDDKAIQELIQQSVKDIMKNMENMSKEDYLGVLNGIQSAIPKINSDFKLKEVPGALEKLRDVLKGAISGAELAGVKSEALLSAKAFLSPKEGIETLANKLAKMSDEEYLSFIERTPLSSWEKESVIKVMRDIGKVWDNIPKDECKQIFGALIKQLNENPDKFAQMIENGDLMKIFNTPQLKTAVAAAGISWTAFMLVMTYAIESWLAEIQLRAGRLGVKEAMDSLKDHRYYANIIPEENSTQAIAQASDIPAAATAPENHTAAVQAPEATDLLAKYKKS